MRWAPARLKRDMVLALPLLLALAYSWMPAGVSVPNERSRLYLAMSLVDQHSVSIDGPVARFGNIYDIASRDGHLYSDKAPGSSLLGALVYWAVRMFSKASEWQLHELINLMRTWVMLPLGIVGFWVIRKLLRDLDLDEASVDTASIAWMTGSAAFHCSTAFMGHQIVAVSLLGALTLLLHCERRATDGTAPLASAWPVCLAAGFCAGFALLTEYQSAMPLALLAGYTLMGPLQRKPLWLLTALAGALPPVLALLAYNDFAFGGPFQLSYHHLVDQQLQSIHGSGVGGVSRPRLAFAFGGMFSLHRGLFATSPFFLLLVPGLGLARRRIGTRLTTLLGLMVLCYLWFISSTPVWHAGWGFGPRLLVPVMPFATVLVAFTLSSWRKSPVGAGVCLGLIVASVTLHQLVHAVFPELPERFVNPLLDLVFPALAADVVTPNLAMRSWGIGGLASLAPLLPVALAAIVFLAARLLGPLLRLRLGVAMASAAACLSVMVIVLALASRAKPDASVTFIAWMKSLWTAEVALRAR